MNKAELIGALESKLGSKKAASDALEAVLDVIIREVAKGGKVGITGFGTFQKVARGARTGRNPRTGETVKIKKTTVPKFNAGTAFKKVVADPRLLPKAAAAGGRASAGAAVKATTAAAGATKTAAKRATSTAKSAATKTAKAAPAKAAPAKRAATTKAAATKTAKAAPAKATPAKKATTTKAAATKTATKTAKAAPAKKATATKAAATKAAPARKAVTKKATPAKTTTAGRPRRPDPQRRRRPGGSLQGPPGSCVPVVREGRRGRQRIGWPSPIPTIQRRVTVSPPSSTLTRWPTRRCRRPLRKNTSLSNQRSTPSSSSTLPNPVCSSKPWTLACTPATLAGGPAHAGVAIRSSPTVNRVTVVWPARRAPRVTRPSPSCDLGEATSEGLLLPTIRCTGSSAAAVRLRLRAR